MILYPQDFEHRIDFDFIRARLSSYCSFDKGRAKVDEMRFLNRRSDILPLLSVTREMLDIHRDATLTLPDGDKYNLDAPLHRIRLEGLSLEEDELGMLRVTMQLVCDQQHFLSALSSDRFPMLHTLPDGYDTAAARDVVAMIDRLLDRYGNIRDNASSELARIRRELRQAEGSVSRLLTQILKQAQAEGYVEADTTPTIREGRLVIPVSPAYKRKVQGIVHDESATGKTIYIEPTQVVEANNHIRELENDERREKKRLLREITDSIRPLRQAIAECTDLLAQTDFLQAKAKLARELGAIEPQIADEPLVDWHRAVHPVLYLNFLQQNREVVPLDIRLQAPDRILIISGPNAGGKSVCLKTVALLQYMMQCGLLVPLREDSVMGIFRQMMIDIGDSQSISDDLSTYSSHLRNMKYFLRHADAHTLVMIDEFGSGTEPVIGGAIAQATLMQLNSAQTYGIITTHYNSLKHLAEDTEGLTNGAMLYDRGQLRPLFVLAQGQPGSSFALEIAQQIGLGSDIIEQAKQIVGDEKIDYDRHLQDIARDKRYWENKRQQVRQKEKHLEERIAYYEEEIAQLKDKRRETLEAAKKEAADLLQRSNATIENTIRQIREADAEKQKTRQARQQIEQLKQDILAHDDEPKSKNRHKSKKKKSQATPVSENKTETKPRKQVLHDFGELRSLTKRGETRVVSEGRKQTSTVSDVLRQRKLHFRQEIDLRGMRADEALQELIAYIDEAVMVGTDSVRIIHGTGTGALKQVVRDYLKTDHHVVGFHDGDPDKGGAGITIAEL